MPAQRAARRRGKLTLASAGLEDEDDSLPPYENVVGRLATLEKRFAGFEDALVASFAYAAKPYSKPETDQAAATGELGAEPVTAG